MDLSAAFGLVLDEVNGIWRGVAAAEAAPSHGGVLASAGWEGAGIVVAATDYFAFFCAVMNGLDLFIDPGFAAGGAAKGSPEAMLFEHG